jgi:lipoprotein-releasing system permease protein
MILGHFLGVNNLLSARIALRFLKKSRSQTILIIIGLGIGIAVQIFVGSLLQNLQAGFLNNIVDRSPHVSVIPSKDEVYITDWEYMVDEISDIDDIETIGVTADSPAQALIGNKTVNVLVRGLSPELSKDIYRISGSIYKGEKLTANDEVLLGKEFSEEYKVKVGDRLTLAAVKGFETTIENFTVVGLYDLENPSLNGLWVITTLEGSQDFFQMGNNVTAIETQIEDVFAADDISDDIRDKLDTDKIKVENWKEKNPQFFSAVSAQSASSYMIQTFVLMSVIIGIASVLSITVIQKSRQIGILKAMGIKDRQAGQIFMFQGLFIGLGGAIFGLTLGAILFYGFIQAITSSGNSFLTADFNITFMVASAIVAILSSVGASILPALKSRKLNPIEVIRNG